MLKHVKHRKELLIPLAIKIEAAFDAAGTLTDASAIVLRSVSSAESLEMISGRVKAPLRWQRSGIG
jgi:hypothetical protein